MKFLKYTYIFLVLLAACFEQRAVDQFKATVNRRCVHAPIERTIDRHLNTHPLGCVFVQLEETLEAGLDEVDMTPGVYTTPAATLGFQHYRNDVIVVRAVETKETLAFMTPRAYHEIAQAADAIKEAQVKDEHLQEGKGLIIFSERRVFTPTQPTLLTQDQVRLVQKSL